MLKEHFHSWYELLVNESGSALGDDTYYYPDANGFQLDGLKDVFWLYVDDTAGASGTNTYTVEALFRGDSVWRDKTNDWFSVANFTTDQELDRSTITACLQAVRIKQIRSGDLAALDGAVTIKGSFQRKVVG